MPGRADTQTLVPGGSDWAPAWPLPVPVPDGAPGVLSVTRSLDGGQWERIQMARATFTADATVGTRNPRFEFIDSAGLVYYSLPLSTGVVAGQSITANLAIDGPTGLAASGSTNQRLPSHVLITGWAVRFTVDALGAADVWTGIRFYVIQWPGDIVREGPGG